jgi:hypothetical protein
MKDTLAPIWGTPTGADSRVVGEDAGLLQKKLFYCLDLFQTNCKKLSNAPVWSITNGVEEKYNMFFPMNFCGKVGNY